MKYREKKDPNSPTRHSEFQFGTNPMRESEFEKRLILEERAARERVKIQQVLGMQGVDGGYCSDRLFSNKF